MSFNRNNIIMIGESGGGKTSLLRQFIDNRFNENELTTHGVAFRSVDYNYDGLQLKIAIWDSSSLPQYKEVSRLYYKHVSAALIVYDVTNRLSFLRTNYWINAIRKHSTLIKYISLVGNKVDLRDRFDRTGKYITRKEGLEFALRKNVMFFETSAKLSINVEELFSITFDGMIRRYVLTPLQTSVLKYKAIVLGDPNVGKSSLIERLCGHPFPNKRDSMYGKHFNSVVHRVNKCSVSIEFWDTSGQDNQPLQQMYYRSAHTAILVYDIQSEESFKNLHKYLNILCTNCEEMPFIILLGNKRDDKSRRQVDLKDVKDFVDNNDIINIFDEISAKSDQNFAKLLDKVCNNLMNIYTNIPINQNLKIKQKHNKRKVKLKNWFKCGAKYMK